MKMQQVTNTMDDMATQAVEELATLPYFPASEGARKAIMRHILAICDRPERLEWLVDAALAHLRAWEGLATLRALYATRWRPADGIEGDTCTVPGFTPEDSEMACLAGEKIFKAINAAERGQLAGRPVLALPPPDSPEAESQQAENLAMLEDLGSKLKLTRASRTAAREIAEEILIRDFGSREKYEQWKAKADGCGLEGA